MRIKALPGIAGIGAAAMLVGTLMPQEAGTQQDSITKASQIREIQPQYATTADTTIKLKANLTQEQINKARERVKASKVGKVPQTPRQSSQRPSELKAEDGDALTLGDAYRLANKLNKTAREHPYEGFGRDAKTATTNSGEKITMSPAVAYDLNESTVGYPVETTPPASLEERCFGGNTDFDAVIDRFSSCSRMTVIVDYYKISTDKPPEHVGTTTGKLQFFQQQYNTARSMRIFAKMEKDSVSYDWNWWDNTWTAPGIDLTVVGNCIETASGCSATRSPVTLTWENWNSIDTWHYWNINSDETKGYGRDKQSAHRSHVEVYTDTGDYQTINRGSFAERLVRCDSASYIYPDWPQGCVFLETIPRLMYSRASDSPHMEVAEHIYTTQNTPDNTYPTSETAKNFPGEYLMDYSAPGLHRLHKDFHLEQMNANEKHKNEACTQTGEYSNTCLPIWYRPNTDYQDCDEYPFHATLEGAASPNWDFSVWAVDKSHNRSAGQTLMVYMRNHRVLAWDNTISMDYNDRFYVQIVDF